MLLREHHHAGRVTQLASIVARLRHFAHAVVNDQPAVSGEDGRSSAADFEPLPRRHRSRQPVMRVKQAEVVRFEALQSHRAIRNPNAFMIEIHHTGLGLAGGFLGKRAGKERPMKDGQLHFSGMIGNGDGEEAGVLVIHMDKVNAGIRFKRTPVPAASNETNPPIPPGRSAGRSGKTPRKS